MSEKKEIGVMGQKYSDRRTGKSGVLIDRDEKYKTLTFQSDDGKTFNISYSTFHSTWKKVKEAEETSTETTNEEATVEPVEETSTVEPEPEAEDKPKNKSKKKVDKEEDTPSDVDDLGVYANLSDVEAIDKLRDRIIENGRDCQISDDSGETVIYIDGNPVFAFEESYNVMMMPDVFNESNWSGLVMPHTLDIEPKCRFMSVHFTTNPTTLAKICSVIEDAMIKINFYGYVESEEE